LNSLKKQPNQPRSFALLDSILESTSKLMLSLGYKNTTTNKIADKAGVSIGSIYQYFKDKDSVALTLFDKIINDNGDSFQKKLLEQPDLSLNEKLDVLIEHIVDMFIEKKPILDLLFSYAPRFQTSQLVVRSRVKAIQSIATLLSAHAEELAGQDASLASEVIVNAIMGVIHWHILNHQSQLNRESLIRELRALAKRYILKPVESAVID